MGVADARPLYDTVSCLENSRLANGNIADLPRVDSWCKVETGLL
jgi:hypothetical protein